jgi:hypothetical protein
MLSAVVSTENESVLVHVSRARDALLRDMVVHPTLTEPFAAPHLLLQTVNH